MNRNLKKVESGDYWNIRINLVVSEYYGTEVSPVWLIRSQRCGSIASL